MKISLKTRVSRLLIICLIILLGAGIIYNYQDNRIVKPTKWYFLASKSGAIDINSPTKRVIITMEYKKSLDSYDQYLKRCDYGELAASGVSPLGAEYKDIQLCNIPNLSKDEFEIRNKYFREKVDELWRDYYEEHLENVFSGILIGALLWGILAISLFLVRWVMRGEKI